MKIISFPSPRLEAANDGDLEAFLFDLETAEAVGDLAAASPDDQLIALCRDLARVHRRPVREVGETVWHRREALRHAH